MTATGSSHVEGMITFKLPSETLRCIFSTPQTPAEPQVVTESRNLRKRATRAVAAPRTLRKRSSPAENVDAPQISKKAKFKDDSDEDFIGDASIGTDNPRMSESLLAPESASMSESTRTTNKPAKVPYYTNRTENLGEPEGNPTVWADKRQQLCETLPQYKSFQSGAYTSNGRLLGFLIDAKVDPKMDRFNDQIVITTAYAFV